MSHVQKICFEDLQTTHTERAILTLRMIEPKLKLVSENEAERPYTKFIIGGAVMTSVVVAIFVFNPWKTADIKLIKADVFAPHTEFKQLQGTTHVLGSAPAAEDDLYIVATVHITDKLRLPIFLNDYSAMLINPDGTQLNATAIAPRDLTRLEETFPALTPMAQNPLTTREPIQPGESREGTIVLQFPGLTAAAWNGKKSATLTIDLTHQGPQIVSFPAH